MTLNFFTMGSRRLAVSAALAACAALPLAAHAQLDKASTEALESYFEFADYNSGTIAAEQIPSEDYKRLYVLDVRDAGQFAKEHIPGAVNIEWRKVFAERSKLPKDRTILAYCNTGSFSGQVAMALRMAGYENVRILHGGYAEWKARSGLDAYARATKDRK
ncbi:MAG: rhodanese-like domain-containing protein [Polaromonas sp.]|uniref:rhodanese-like domain-containing protein n=1 Tax=Polaromonas sp. TaxID=1869339 RepID=UPI0027377663|nr:rhodanese-like domain-containing protein [Polaromonas sp.]MDP2817945.1 rhodanese-like domain-containing protein [Polaromonas sp.]